MGADRTRELDGWFLDGAGARYEGVERGDGRDRTAGREIVRWVEGFDARELETEGLARLRLVRLVTDPLEPDEGRETLRLDGADRGDCGVRFGVRLKLGPDRPLRRESGRWRVTDPVGPVRLGRRTNDGREGARLREPLETFSGAATGGIDNRRLLRSVKDPPDPDEGRERLRLEVVERVDCGARVGVRTTFTPDRPLGLEPGR